jgi:hypothetical protein
MLTYFVFIIYIFIRMYIYINIFRDNWTYEDVTKFVMDPSCLDAVAAGADGAHRVTLSFMQVYIHVCRYLQV